MSATQELGGCRLESRLRTPTKTPHRAKAQWPLTFNRTPETAAEECGLCRHHRGEHAVTVPANQIKAVGRFRARACAFALENDVDEIHQARGQLIERTGRGCESEERMVVSRSIG